MSWNTFNPFPNTSFFEILNFLKTLWKNDKMLVASIIAFPNDVYKGPAWVSCKVFDS